ncbi:MAG TPA: tRNA 2-thiouridine(34) synthase MnmA [Bacteroidales bacterium]|nr:MAG: tRNA 2-thiouridine(34) synthase MnmA [Bacteroidetes bacterium GWF2_33_38]OFY69609.1 MAG: tRNA 2-thiouridine(34) synthase MnmA [Bacteroidetes bacterium RIFOXYA12_FULL_33_9]OFY90426.1 MAG: tRNA 2-thiouridine(34) synthase MnmA [Bacteroidetes bacterium RIFOXYA2_FULL_33_7]HBF89034.1 tRNA 2-thiouridine(34) synthase MnmA [Bacteroidales bacterium]
MSKGRVLVAMSGGIDSSITALLLHEQGYEVIGITLKTWEYSSTCSTGKESGCCNIDSFNDARELAVSMGIPYYIIDIKEQFEEKIIKNFISEYIAGRTPNPCVICNTEIKWDYFLKKADQLGCEFIATGHYAQVNKDDVNGRYFLSKGIDEKKDQSYVLWGLSQDNLRRTILPLGKYHKSEIKELATQRGFDNLAKKRESYEICFVPNDDYRAFLKTRIPELEKKVDGGNFIDTQGNILGQHKGYPFYTIGQRKGLEIALGQPMYVVDIIAETNTVVIGTKEEVFKQEMYITDINLMKYNRLPNDFEALVKIRYKDSGEFAILSQEGNKINVKFANKVSAITPGQSAVFYEGENVIGGGVIC